MNIIDLLLYPFDLLVRWYLELRTYRSIKSSGLDVDIKPLDFHASADGITATYVSSAIAFFADEASEMLQKNKGAENYVSFEMLPRADRRLPPIVVTVQWKHGKSPATKAAEAVQDLVASQARFNHAQDAVENLVAALTNVNTHEFTIPAALRALQQAGLPEMADNLAVKSFASMLTTDVDDLEVFLDDGPVGRWVGGGHPETDDDSKPWTTE